jgi:hypothetical protein
LNIGKSDEGATENSNFGYFGGGGSPGVSRVERIDYSNDSATASIRGSLSSSGTGRAAAGNSNFGYFVIGSNPNIRKINYSNDLSTALNRNSIDSQIATGNSNFGWHLAVSAFPGPYISTIRRIDYANDTETPTVRGPLGFARFGMAATGNSNFGYFSGGYGGGGHVIVNRIDYSNDLSTASIRGSLSLVVYNHAGVTNASNS